MEYAIYRTVDGKKTRLIYGDSDYPETFIQAFLDSMFEFDRLGFAKLTILQAAETKTKWVLKIQRKEVLYTACVGKYAVEMEDNSEN